ncbi:MAG: hypothetical protein HYY03_00775 [Chloroflexi bacterium]|nr:hypothetical protein [Chloroflexota bacterium]
MADVIADSPRGRFYMEQKESGHPFYAGATFYTLAELRRLLEDAGMRIGASSSTLVQDPSAHVSAEEPAGGIAPDASFICLLAKTA